ncbi:YitT family protein, partial [Bacillus sp. SIMBA_161]
LTRQIAPVTHESLVAAIFGGVVIGIGIGLVFLWNGSTGGTALAAKIISKYTGLTLGTSLAMMHGLMVLAAMSVFGID